MSLIFAVWEERTICRYKSTVVISKFYVFFFVTVINYAICWYRKLSQGLLFALIECILLCASLEMYVTFISVMTRKINPISHLAYKLLHSLNSNSIRPSSNVGEAGDRWAAGTDETVRFHFVVCLCRHLFYTRRKHLLFTFSNCVFIMKENMCSRTENSFLGVWSKFWALCFVCYTE